MNVQYSGKRGIARPAHTFYMVSVLAFLQNMNFDYVTKMVYNKDKDLVFVYRPDGFWNEHEYINEMHHLEQMVPSPVTSYKNMTMQREDGILTIYDMSTREYLKFYNEDKYWNSDLKEDFVNQTRSMWRGNACKYNGRIFNISHRANEEVALAVSFYSSYFQQMKVDRELQEAIAKHGEVQLPK